jgi:hypothetical protein
MEEKNKNQSSEPETADHKKCMQFYSSFEEAENDKRKVMAMMSPVERMQNLERMRKHFLSHRLDAEGNWKPLKRIITIHRGTFL